MNAPQGGFVAHADSKLEVWIQKYNKDQHKAWRAGSIRFSTKHTPSVPSWCARPSWPTRNQSPGNVEWNPLPCRQGVQVTNRIEKFHKTLRICVSTEATSQLQEPFWAGFFDAHQQTIHADSYIYIIYHVSYLTNTTYPDVNIYHFGSTPFPAALPKVPTPSVLEIWNQGIRTNRQK